MMPCAARKVFRQALAPLLSTPSLEAVLKALEEDSKDFIQGVTTQPPPLGCLASWPVEAACFIGFCVTTDQGGFKNTTIGRVEEAFANICMDVDKILGEPAAIRWFLNWHDDAPRDEVRTELAEEVRIELRKRYSVNSTESLS